MEDEVGDLPEAYGTQRLLLAARDPHWLYAHWDLSTSQLREYNSLSADRHLVVRVFVGDFSSAPCTEVHVHPESRNWFIHVGRGGTRYVAELGYYAKGTHHWVSLSKSGATLTPPDTVSADATTEFATIPVEIPFETLVALIKAAAMENIPLAEAILQLRATGYMGLPEAIDWPTAEWTPEQERALAEAIAEMVSMDQVQRVWVGSLEITELLRRKLAQQRGSEALAEIGLPSGGLGSISSPFGGQERPRAFWFNVNAELIIYGATEPDATVTLAGRTIRLRPDGTFSYRFALPDGQYDLPATATSADGVDQRAAGLSFGRTTVYRGEVGVHPQDPRLKPPKREHIE